jgi:hypothetical protein
MPPQDDENKVKPFMPPQDNRKKNKPLSVGWIVVIVMCALGVSALIAYSFKKWKENKTLLHNLPQVTPSNRPIGSRLPDLPQVTSSNRPIGSRLPDLHNVNTSNRTIGRIPDLHHVNRPIRRLLKSPPKNIGNKLLSRGKNLSQYHQIKT